MISVHGPAPVIHSKFPCDELIRELFAALGVGDLIPALANPRLNLQKENFDISVKGLDLFLLELRVDH